MQLLGVSLALGAALALGHALPLNSSLSRHASLCDYLHQQSLQLMDTFVPQCDAHGNFLPQQCHSSSGFCWCVDVITGEEVPGTRTPPGTLRVDCGLELSCPHGWARFGKRCFGFIDSSKPWAEAESYCLFEGGNLASVHSYEENHFIQVLSRADTHDFPRCWLGGHDAIHPNFWMWSDGSEFHYENWGKHIDLSRSEHCVQMNDGYERRWSYASCSESLPFVCARKI